jgi:hypothetical protein
MIASFTLKERTRCRHRTDEAPSSQQRRMDSVLTGGRQRRRRAAYRFMVSFITIVSICLPPTSEQLVAHEATIE